MGKDKVSCAKIKVLVVDDHPAVREALAVRHSPKMSTWKPSAGRPRTVAQVAARFMGETKPDITITDITLKKSDGIDLDQAA